ncbi:hypothetical protein A6M21_15330 [Desulfotomaculum copahuensis]|uniref:Uncharacterized protein n=1 Tax=Desulfotomaculum copahuensis TaxID=1838280 RepID=A0A1B7LBB8_9FIRM|nr:hypothetical protein A6M21_15330 [Desulfotomaculum copahuensis]
MISGVHHRDVAGVSISNLSKVSPCGWGFYYPALSEAEAREQPLFFTGLRKRPVLRFIRS